MKTIMNNRLIMDLIDWESLTCSCRRGRWVNMNFGTWHGHIGNIYIYMYIFIHMCVCIYICIYVLMCVYIYIYVCVYICMCIYICILYNILTGIAETCWKKIAEIFWRTMWVCSKTRVHNSVVDHHSLSKNKHVTDME